MKRRPWETWWDTLSPDDFPRNNNGRRKSHESNTIIAQLVETIGGSVLDVGCGSGISYEYLKSRFYTGVDFTPKFLRTAKAIVPEAPCICASAFYLPFPDQSFDTVFCKALLEHQHPDEWQLVIQEMHRVAIRQLIIVFYLAPHKQEREVKRWNALFINRYNKRTIITLLKSLKRFKDLSITEDIGIRKDAIYAVALG